MSKTIYFLIPLGIFLIGAMLSQQDPKWEEHQELRQLSSHLSTMPVLPVNELNFAGEPVDLDRPGIRTRLETEVQKLVNAPVATRVLMRRAMRYRPAFSSILKRRGIPEDFFYLAMAESGLSNVTSSKGASGFWQFMPETARLYGLEVSEEVDERYHPEKACYAATRYLKHAHGSLGQWTLAAAAYNMGTGGLENAVDGQCIEDYFDLELNRETSNYVYRILALKVVIEHPEMFGMESNISPYPRLRYREIAVNQSIDDLVTFAEDVEVHPGELRTLNPWILGSGLNASAEKSYVLRIPAGGIVQADELMVNSGGEEALSVKEEGDSEVPEQTTAGQS